MARGDAMRIPVATSGPPERAAEESTRVDQLLAGLCVAIGGNVDYPNRTEDDRPRRRGACMDILPRLIWSVPLSLREARLDRVPSLSVAVTRRVRLSGAMLWRSSWFISSLAWLAPAVSAAQDPAVAKVVRVFVRDVRTRTAIPGVELIAEGGQVLNRTDAAGMLQVRVIGTAPFVGQMRRVGYVPSLVTVTGREPEDSVLVLLAPTSAQTLGVVEVITEAVVARFAEFDRRRLSGGPGVFLTDSQIAKAGQFRLTDVFRRISSLYVWDSAGTYLVTSARSRRPVITITATTQVHDLAPCVLQVLVDNVRMPWGFDLNLLDRGDIHGIEIYSGPATVPPEYNGTSKQSTCGIIAIWTKSR